MWERRDDGDDSEPRGESNVDESVLNLFLHAAPNHPRSFMSGAAGASSSCGICTYLPALLLLTLPALAAKYPIDEIKAALDEPIAPRATGSCPTPERFSVTRPDPEGVPTLVGLAVQFQDVSALNDVDQTIASDLYLVARWLDPRLADSNRGDGSVDCTASLKPFWMPAIEPENLRVRQRFYDDRVLLNARGIVTVVRRLLVQVVQPMDFTDFPLDRHTWKFTVWPVYSNASELLFYALPATSGPERPTIQGWRISAPTAQTAVAQRSNRLGAFARFDAVLELRRMPQFYAWKLGLPLLLIGLMAYLVYFIPPAMVPQQIALGMTSILTAVAYMFALTSSLPRIGYVTRADRLFVGVITLAFLSLVKGVLTTGLQSSGRLDLVAKFDRVGRWLYPTIMASVFISAFLA
jgi:neurotransmitter-gated ion-channel